MYGNYFALARSSFALSTAADALTIIGASNRRLYIVEISFSGLGTVSAANEVLVSRSTGGTTGGGAITAAKMFDNSAAAAFTNFTTWSAVPTLTGTGLLRLGVNANGGVYRWVARPGSEIELVSTEQVSIRPVSGSSNVGLHVLVCEK
jgi:hypothetical protein